MNDETMTIRFVVDELIGCTRSVNTKLETLSHEIRGDIKDLSVVVSTMGDEFREMVSTMGDGVKETESKIFVQLEVLNAKIDTTAKKLGGDIHSMETMLQEKLTSQRKSWEVKFRVWKLSCKKKLTSLRKSWRAWKLS